MPEALGSVLQTDGLIWLLIAVIAAGLVRGFSGFGSAMVMMPVAASVLTPFAAITFLTVVELVGPLPNLPDALRRGDRADASRLLLGALIGLPFGIWALSRLSPEVFGWSVSLIVLGLLSLLIAGWRYARTLSAGTIVGVGGLGGFLSGVSGLAGPPVIMLYMSSRLPAEVIRANFLLYLLGIDMMMLAAFWLMGQLQPAAIVTGVAMIVPYVLANMAGAQLFRPGAERQFRAVAYAIIAASAILGLPIWG
ncbi:sulfite exporter TauE/SafE family protein [Sulfitobacter sp. LCG007]